MRLFCSVLTFSLFQNVGFVSGRWETGLDGDLYGEVPRPTTEPLLYRDEFKHGAVLMETRLGSPRNGTTRRDLALGSRQLTCNDPGYFLACPITKPLPCCPLEHPVCCQNPASTVCCSTGSFCVGLASCCYDGQVGCTNPEGCCPGGTKCCGLYCCGQAYECRSGECVNEALSSLSVASIRSVQAERDRSLSSVAARQSSLESVASVRSKSIESAASVASVEGKQYTTPRLDDSPTATVYGNDNDNSNSNSNSNSNVALVGGVVGGVLGATVLGLIGFLLWKRTKGAPASPPAGQQPFFGQPPSSQPITPASPTFSAHSHYFGGLPVTYAAQPGWNPQQLSALALPGADSPTAGQPSTTSQQSAPPPVAVNTWIERPHTIHQEMDGRPASQSPSLPSSPTEGPVVPKELYGDAIRGSTYSVTAAMNVPSSAPGASGSQPPYAPPYPPVPANKKTGPWQI